MGGSSIALALVAVAVSAGCASSGASTPPPSGSRSTATADRFLTKYVTADGRVIRRDQGGDIVSEGQAYGMLVAELARRPDVARTIWSWTRRHLARADGLFAWHATSAGRVEDPQSATDADILLAYALLRYDGTGGSSLHAAGRRVAQAVLAHEAVRLPNGAVVPVAGPWATSTSPPSVNPSYLMPGVFDALARFTRDRRWSTAAAAAIDLVGQVTTGGRRLPPDWAVLSGGGLAPAPQPGGGAPVQYSLDAARLPLWFSTACHGRARRIAAAWWGILRTHNRSAALALTLGGLPLETSRNPLTLLAAAAGATAAGDHAAARTLLVRAEATASTTPTYYGDAWAALGPALLDGRLAPCGGA